MTAIHPSAVVHPGAELDSSVQVGPWTVIGPHVKVGPGTTIGSFVVLDGHLTIGQENRISHHVVIGTAPQDLRYKDEPTRLEMGDRNVIREFVTIHRGTPHGGGLTQILSDIYVMAYSHIAHDNQIGNHVVMANNVHLGGHVLVGDFVNISGCSAVHQFVRIGPYAFVGGGSMVSTDVPPFCRASGNHARLQGLNAVGLSRHGFSKEDLQALKRAYRLAFSSGLLAQEAADRIDTELADRCPHTASFAQFLRDSTRGITR